MISRLKLQRKVAFALFLISVTALGMLTVWSTVITRILSVKAVTEVPTSAFISVEPSPAVYNETIHVTIWISPLPPTPTDTFTGWFVDIGYPDGTHDFYDSFGSEWNGTLTFDYVPIMAGNYTFQHRFYGQYFANGTIHYMPSNSSIMELSVSEGPPPQQITIKEDGSVDPPTAPISTVNNVTYTVMEDLLNYTLHVQRSNTVIDGAGHTLRGLNTGIFGITLSALSNVTITNFTIEQFSCGINVVGSSHIISGNTITNNYQGIFLSSSSGNTITNNTISVIRYGGTAVYLGASDSNTITCNTISGNPGVSVDYSNNNLISGNYITESIHFYFYSGIKVQYSSGNMITGNTIINNPYGISVWVSSGNTIYHNNFINNTQQADSDDSPNVWDGGYPSGGNYWSDYTGVDADGDGIGDTPYVINASNTDRYPFIQPFGLGPMQEAMFNITWQEENFPVLMAANASVTSFDFNQPQKQISFNATGSSDTTLFCHITIPKSLMTGSPWAVTVNGAPIDYVQAENATHTIISFTYTFQSTLQIVIQGSTVIPEALSAPTLTLIMALFTFAIAIIKIKLPEKPKHNS